MQEQMQEQIKISKAPLGLGIASLVTWLIPLIGGITSIVGIVLSVKNLKIVKCKAYKIGLALNIVGLVATIVNFIISFIIIYNTLI
ncbi:MAG: hypothetical protein ACRCW0_03350 [Clostridium sp.]